MIETPTATVIPPNAEPVIVAKTKHVIASAVGLILACLFIGGLIGFGISHAHEIGIIKADNAAITKLTNEGYQLNMQMSEVKQREQARQQFFATHYIDSKGDWRETKPKHGK